MPTFERIFVILGTLNVPRQFCHFGAETSRKSVWDTGRNLRYNFFEKIGYFTKILVHPFLPCYFCPSFTTCIPSFLCALAQTSFGILSRAFSAKAWLCWTRTSCQWTLGGGGVVCSLAVRHLLEKKVPVGSPRRRQGSLQLKKSPDRDAEKVFLCVQNENFGQFLVIFWWYTGAA